MTSESGHANVSVRERGCARNRHHGGPRDIPDSNRIAAISGNGPSHQANSRAFPSTPRRAPPHGRIRRRHIQECTGEPAILAHQVNPTGIEQDDEREITRPRHADIVSRALRFECVTAIRRPGRGPGAARVLLLQALGELVGAAILLELAIELDDLVERTRMLFLVFAVEQVGVQIGEQGVLGTIGRAEAVAQRVVSRGLGGRVFGRIPLDDLVQ